MTKCLKEREEIGRQTIVHRRIVSASFDLKLLNENNRRRLHILYEI